MKMKMQLRNVRPNPFRHIERYPIQEEKITALKKSIKDTEFWENIVARQKPDGTVEIAYGHHRLHALREMYSGTHEFDFIIKDLDETAMCKIMVHENMDEWGSSASVEQESLRAIVEGYADGRIELGELSKDTPSSQIRYAPSFIQGGRAGLNHARPYTTTQLASFTGWKDWKVKAVLASLELIEQGSMKDDDYKGLMSSQQKEVNTEVKRQQKITAKRVEMLKEEGDTEEAEVVAKRGEAEVKQVANAVIKNFTKDKEKGTPTRTAAEVASDVRASNSPKDAVEFPDINKVAGKLAVKIGNLLDDDKEMGRVLRSIIKSKRYLADNYKASLIDNLSDLADSANILAKQLKSGK
ncbi:MAG: hypothetical protein DRQ39_03750 [Gammaproteobacteria bacterium]|nr:MAG: hypothetical protein DRQ39_03750 [Gammaproteobacteria bacterium]